MSVSASQLRASKKYHAKFERVFIRVSSERKTEIENHASMMNESVNLFIQRAIAEAMERDIAIIHDANKTPAHNKNMLDDLINEARSFADDRRVDTHKKESDLDL